MHLPTAVLAFGAISTYVAPAIAMVIKPTSTSLLKPHEWTRKYPDGRTCASLCDSASCSREPDGVLFTCNPVRPAATSTPAAARDRGLIDADNGVPRLKPRQGDPTYTSRQDCQTGCQGTCFLTDDGKYGCLLGQTTGFSIPATTDPPAAANPPVAPDPRAPEQGSMDPPNGMALLKPREWFDHPSQCANNRDSCGSVPRPEADRPGSSGGGEDSDPGPASNPSPASNPPATVDQSFIDPPNGMPLLKTRGGLPTYTREDDCYVNCNDGACLRTADDQHFVCTPFTTSYSPTPATTPLPATPNPPAAADPGLIDSVNGPMLKARWSLTFKNKHDCISNCRGGICSPNEDHQSFECAQLTDELKNNQSVPFTTAYLITPTASPAAADQGSIDPNNGMPLLKSRQRSPAAANPPAAPEPGIIDAPNGMRLLKPRRRMWFDSETDCLQICGDFCELRLFLGWFCPTSVPQQPGDLNPNFHPPADSTPATTPPPAASGPPAAPEQGSIDPPNGMPLLKPRHKLISYTLASDCNDNCKGSYCSLDADSRYFICNWSPQNVDLKSVTSTETSTRAPDPPADTSAPPTTRDSRNEPNPMNPKNGVPRLKRRQLQFPNERACRGAINCINGSCTQVNGTWGCDPFAHVPYPNAVSPSEPALFIPNDGAPQR